MSPRGLSLLLPLACLLAACGNDQADDPVSAVAPALSSEREQYAAQRVAIYAPFTLTADLRGLTGQQKKMLPLLIEAADIMDALFWRQAYGDRDALLAGIEHGPTRRFVALNYGPWDRLAGDRPFVDGVADKPKGAAFYPADMTAAEFDAADLPDKTSLYTLLRRDTAGALMTVRFSEAYAAELDQAAALLEQAAALAEDPGFERYLTLRAAALRSDDYQPSDLAWLDMKNNAIDVVIGAIETYEDQLFGYKAGYEAYVLIKDQAWSERLARYGAFLPDLQAGLPVPDAYKAEQPGTDSDLNAYDVIYYAGHSNAGSKTIAINLPNDEAVQLAKGTRRLQLQNAMRAKFDKILVPIADTLIAAEQRQHITFDAFFGNVMFHEVAHGLGIKNTLDGAGTVRAALKDWASPLEEGKADILGLYMITRLLEQGELEEGSLEDYYVTFMASIFRSTRFGAASAHGRANMVRFNYFADRGAFARDGDSGTYRVDMAAMAEAMTELSRLILTLQGDGDYAGVARLFDDLGVIRPQLQADLDRLAAAGIPVDITFQQGLAQLDL